MTLHVKIGRRIHRKKDGNFITRNLNNARNVLSIQQYMWRTILYGFKVAATKAKREEKKAKKNNIENNFSFTKIKHIEEEDHNYDIEWLEIQINSTPEIEQQQYESAQNLFKELEEHSVLKRFVEEKESKNDENKLDDDIAKTYNIKNSKFKESLQKGFEATKTQTLSKLLNEVGIISIVEFNDKKENESK